VFGNAFSVRSFTEHISSGDMKEEVDHGTRDRIRHVIHIMTLDSLEDREIRRERMTPVHICRRSDCVFEAVAIIINNLKTFITPVCRVKISSWICSNKGEMAFAGFRRGIKRYARGDGPKY
jgi:hypothetical protein